MEAENQPLVSILIPLYNQERYLDACMRSVCNQTYKNLEIIVVNDGSTDNSPLMAERWAQKDSRIKIVNKKNEGLPMARKDGYLNATGQYVCFVDSDDMMHTSAVEVLLKHIEQNHVDMVVGASKHMLGFLKWGNITGSFPKNHIVRQPELFDKYFVNFFGKTRFPFNMWARLIRKKAIDEASQHTEVFMKELRFMGEDLYFHMKLFPYLQSMMMVDDLVYYYRYGGTLDHFNKLYPELFKLADIRLGQLDKYHYDEGYEPLYDEYVNMVYYHAEQLLQYKQGGKDDIVSFFQKELSEREVFLRMKSHYLDKKPTNERMANMLRLDSQSMYNQAVQSLNARCNNLPFKAKRLLLNWVERIS